MPTPKFDPTINFGHILQIAAFVIAVMFAYTDLLRVTDAQDLRIKALETEALRGYQNQREIITTLTTIKEDIATIKAQRQ